MRTGKKWKHSGLDCKEKSATRWQGAKEVDFFYLKKTRTHARAHTHTHTHTHTNTHTCTHRAGRTTRARELFRLWSACSTSKPAPPVSLSLSLSLTLSIMPSVSLFVTLIQGRFVLEASCFKLLDWRGRRKRVGTVETEGHQFSPEGLDDVPWGRARSAYGAKLVKRALPPLGERATHEL